MALKQGDKVKLRDFLVEHFSISELKLLCFEVGIKYELFPHEALDEFSMELILYCGRRNQIGCLLQQIAVVRDSDFINNLLAKQKCRPLPKIVVIMEAQNLMVSEEEFTTMLMKAFGTTDPDSIVLLAARRGTIELVLTYKSVRWKSNYLGPKRIGPFIVLETKDFDILSPETKEIWRNRHLNYFYENVRFGKKMTRDAANFIEEYLLPFYLSLETSAMKIRFSTILDDPVASDFVRLVEYYFSNRTIDSQKLLEILQILKGDIRITQLK